MENNDVLLSYYTKSMTIHATVTIAVVFGLFSLLGIISNASSLTTKIGLSLGFIPLMLFGWYEIKRYKHYGSVAKERTKAYKTDEGDEYKGIMGSIMIKIFPKAEILFVLLMTWSLVFIWLDYLFKLKIISIP